MRASPNKTTTRAPPPRRWRHRARRVGAPAVRPSADSPASQWRKGDLVGGRRGRVKTPGIGLLRIVEERRYDGGAAVIDVNPVGDAWDRYHGGMRKILGD